jgi:hypothetical protein
MKNNSVSNYFDNPPIQWGLRGDPFLWNEMRTKIDTVNAPTTAKEFEDLLHKLFAELTGEKAKPGRNIFVPRYDLGGMSRGLVSSDFWLERGFHLIIQRFKEA